MNLLNMIPQQSKQRVGVIGEDLASQYLTKHGFTILERNFQKRYGEIDIIAKEKETLVFVEVKTRKGSAYGSGEESITPWKVKQLVQTAHYYRMLHPNLPQSMRIDVIVIILTSGNLLSDLKHYPNITMDL